MSEYEITVCPRCGEELFADMRVCYGCLYEFTAQDNGPAPPTSDVPAMAFEGPAVEDAPAVAVALPALKEDEPFLWDAGLPPVESMWEDDTLDLLGADEAPTAVLARAAVSHPSREILCLVRTPSVDMRLPIPEMGLVVGRDPACDVVLHSRAISRTHVRILPAKAGEQGMRVIDLGATNPAMYCGREVRGETLVPIGWTVSICGTFVTPVWSER